MDHDDDNGDGVDGNKNDGNGHYDADNINT